MILDFLILILIVRYLKKTLETATYLPTWDKIFTGIFYLSIICLVLSVSVHKSQFILSWVGQALLLGMLYILYTKQEFKSTRSYILAIAPYAFISVIINVTKSFFSSFYNEWQELIGMAELFAIIWLIAMLLINRKQQKALLKEKLKTKEEEELNKATKKLKDELEILVTERTSEITRQKEELEHTLNELRSTQTQLIQSEKMASLGELTAGIAHEIQNPLNFVNNFSEVSTELIKEMVEEFDKGNKEEVKTIATDLVQNLEKILHHGKRADAIVKGMLQHSRSSSNVKEPTDINALADEYLRLSYHGLRAKDKSFNATMKTDFDPSIGKVNVISQDVGRVILNLLTNAFYAVNQKSRSAVSTPNSDKYEPTVSVTTKKEANKVLIIVSDNGNGIPKSALDKIFQPFFTTKPTGEGTGLGLSLSYDIIAKGHGGELKVETVEGQGTTFIIKLPA